MIDEFQEFLIINTKNMGYISLFYTEIGSYWERGNLNEIDIVAIDSINKELFLCEVKINPKKLNKQKLILKSVNLVKNYNDYKIEYRLLSLEDLKCYH